MCAVAAVSSVLLMLHVVVVGIVGSVVVAADA